MKNKGLIKLTVVLMATVVFAVFVFFQSPVSNIDRENITNISYAHGAGPQWQSLYVLQDKESINAVADALEQLDLSFAILRETGAELLKKGYTVKESAHMVGYEDEFNFSKTFNIFLCVSINFRHNTQSPYHLDATLSRQTEFPLEEQIQIPKSPIHCQARQLVFESMRPNP